ncbi:hypothetical protein evm_002323 [Chilo suppressalis]|nr:hypothetical protein evm_002323 [Chilo suppressalis]
MMFSDEEIKETPENSFMRPGDEIISIREVCLSDKFDKKDLGFHNELLSNTSKNYLDVSRSIFRDEFAEGLEQQARFAWTEEDGNIAALVSEPGFGTTGQTTFGKDLDAALKCEMKEADTSSSALTTISRNGLTFRQKPYVEPQLVTSTSNDNRSKTGQNTYKVDKADPRSRYHFVKYVKRHGRTVKLWECGICSREFQHQYTLMRHLPTHTDERNFHCNACGKSFRQLSTLSQHRAIHSADRPYACEVCHKTFNRVSTLISHRKTHSDDKPYKCHFCPKGFHQKGNLRNHLFTHTNERPYRCNICLKGFNQQSNLVCHKNKAHREDGGSPIASRTRNDPKVGRSLILTQPNATRTQTDNCEVTSSVGLPPVEEPPINWNKTWDSAKPYQESETAWKENPWSAMGSGVIVNPIKTYHMGVALATRQTPFALLKPNNSTPVLVKVIDTKLPGGKQMLVPATAEDLKVGGKIVLQNDGLTAAQAPVESTAGLDGAVQIRVPVVAIVVPKIKAGGQLHLAVEEPHHAYHTALSADGDRMSSCALPPPAPSPPLDLIHMDLFEPMECIPMGPQITAVDNIDQPPHSDDSDIFIGEFEESIPLSDSE